MFQQAQSERLLSIVSIPDPTRKRSSPTPAEPRATLVMVAARAGVSKSTAGYVLSGQEQRMRISEQTRHRVLRAAAEMNYRPNVMARSLRTTVTRPIALISDTLASEAYGGELIEGCVSAAAECGRLTFIGETRRDPALQAALVEEFLAEQAVDFVFASVYPRELTLPDGLNRARVVMLNCAAGDPGVPCVLPDELAAGRTAADILLDQGVAERVWVLGDRAPHGYAPGRDRETGLRHGLLAGGHEVAALFDCAWEPEPTYEALKSALAAGETPTALVAMNDRVALGAYQALAEAGGRIPDDVSVLAFEGSNLAGWLRPQLTTVDRPLRSMARLAIRHLAGEERLEGVTRVPLAVRRRLSV